MRPGPSQILTCPHCGAKKRIMTIASGNTFGAALFSDNKFIAPMLPEISYVQRCLYCDKYFIRSRQKEVYDESGIGSLDSGLLSFAEMKEAFIQLSQEKFRSMKEKRIVRMMLHHAYNNVPRYFIYFRKPRPLMLPKSRRPHLDGEETITEDDTKLFHDNALWLIEHYLPTDVLKAEFYREAGEMVKAKALIDGVMVKTGSMRRFVTDIKDRILRNETEVFKVRYHWYLPPLTSREWNGDSNASGAGN